MNIDKVYTTKFKKILGITSIQKCHRHLGALSSPKVTKRIWKSALASATPRTWRLLKRRFRGKAARRVRHPGVVSRELRREQSLLGKWVREGRKLLEILVGRAETHSLEWKLLWHNRKFKGQTPDIYSHPRGNFLRLRAQDRGNGYTTMQIFTKTVEKNFMKNVNKN